MPFLEKFFFNIFRPSIKTIKVIVYENQKEKDLALYSDQQLTSLVNSIDSLWFTETNSSFWFETDVYERHTCFQTPSTEMIVTCYQKDLMTNGFKKKMAIPIRYRKKFFDKVHALTPEPVGMKSWPFVEVKFVIPHS